MRVTPLALPEVLLVEQRVARDERGWFYESWSRQRFADAHDGLDVTFVQDNLSRSHRGVLRGLHLQHPHGQGKLVSVLHGEVFDVAVDVRHGSDFTRFPRASITALMPVGVERITGKPSSAARSRACARCCGGPQRPNQASLEGLKMKPGRLRSSTTWPEKMIS